MTAWWIVGLAIASTLVALWKPHFIWGLVSFAAWWFVFYYTRTNPLTGITVGDAGDSIFIAVVWGFGCGTLLITVLRDWNDRKEARKKEESEARSQGVNTKGNKETSDEYYERLNNINKTVRKRNG